MTVYRKWKEKEELGEFGLNAVRLVKNTESCIEETYR